jgi:ABC-2 type transport system permease protein
MRSLTGSRALLRLALRRDRIRLPIWIVSIVGIVVAQLSGLLGIYVTEQDRLRYAATMSGSGAARIFGSVDGPSLGSILVNEIYITAAVLIALMSSMLVVRHTRQNEQRGRLELVGSAIVGRHANLLAALVLAVLANACIAIVMAPMLMAFDLPAGGAIAFAASLAGIGIVFAGIGAVASQVAGSSRGANGLAIAVLGAAFLLRATGDVLGDVRDGTRVVIAWPSWLSPIGWGQLSYPFTELRVWTLALYPLAFVALAAASVLLSARRDLGAGMLPVRPRPGEASWLLSGPVGLAVRLQRGVWLGWCAAMVALGLTFGAFEREIGNVLGENEQASELFARAGGSDMIVESYYAVSFGFFGIMLAAYAVQSMLRLPEEEEGPLASILATSVSRTRWLLANVAVGMVAVTLLLFIGGVTAAAGAELFGDGVVGFRRVLAAAMVQAPALLVMVAFLTLAFGASARHVAAIAWAAFAVTLLGLIGELFQLPDLLLQASPFVHLPLLPSEDMRWAPLLAMLAVTGALVGAGALLFRRRGVAASG